MPTGVGSAQNHHPNFNPNPLQDADMSLSATPIPVLTQAHLQKMFKNVTLSPWTEFGEDKIVPWLKRGDESIDPLAISCAMFRTQGEQDTHLKSLSDKTMVTLVTDADIEMANAIREHRGKELVLAELHRPTGKEPSEYERELASFLDLENKTYNTKWEGMIYKLPEFYKYDCDVAELKAKHFVVTPSNVEEGDYTFTLKPLKRMRRVTRNKRVFQYWCAEAESNIPVILEVKVDNTLDSVWSMFFDVVDKIEVSGTFYKTMSNRLRILASDKWKVNKL